MAQNGSTVLEELVKTLKRLRRWLQRTPIDDNNTSDPSRVVQLIIKSRLKKKNQWKIKIKWKWSDRNEEKKKTGQKTGEG